MRGFFICLLQGLKAGMNFVLPRAGGGVGLRADLWNAPAPFVVKRTCQGSMTGSWAILRVLETHMRPRKRTTPHQPNMLAGRCWLTY